MDPVMPSNYSMKQHNLTHLVFCPEICLFFDRVLAKEMEKMFKLMFRRFLVAQASKQFEWDPYLLELSSDHKYRITKMIAIYLVAFGIS